MHEKTIESARKNGYSRARVDGEVYPLEEIPALDKNKKHSIDIIVDRLVMRDGIRSRLADSVETALSLSDGLLTVIFMTEGKEDLRFSQKYACEEHGISIGELTPRMFSFNAPFGACPRCSGLGELESLSPDKIIPDRSRSLRDGAIVVNGFKSVYEDSWYGPLYEAVGKDFGFTIDTPIRDYSEKAFDALMNGVRGKLYYVERSFDGKSKNGDVEWLGVIHLIEQRRNMTHSDYYDEFMDFTPCPECGGKRLRPDILAVTVGGKSIYDFCSMNTESALKFVNDLSLSPTEEQISHEILKEIRARLNFLISVGLDYLTLSRKAATLSGGEAQRIRLATQIGSSLVGVLYILDEPSIGLHQRDNGKLINTLKKLRDAGNSLIVVEHDEETMLASDYIVDMGPGAGVNGGNVVAAGTPKQIMANPNSLTGKYLSHKLEIPIPEKEERATESFSPLSAPARTTLKMSQYHSLSERSYASRAFPVREKARL